VRLRRVFSGLIVALAASLVAPVGHAQDFDPHGRTRPKPKPKPGTGPGPKPQLPAQDPIEKYTKIVLSRPGEPFPLQKLAQLYRERDGKLDKLFSDLEKRASTPGPEQYAATVALAGVEKIEGKSDEAVKTYERAIALKAGDPTALLALARVLQDRGEVAQARSRFEQALALQTTNQDKEQTLRTLMQLALEGKDMPGAKAFHQQLVRLSPQSLYVKGELGRELYARGEYERAEAEFKDLVTAAQGDNRTLAPALQDLGRAQAKAHKNQEALATLKKALQAAGAEAGVRAEIYETITEIYRADQQLPVLIGQIEAEKPNDFQRLAILGALYEETGDANKAIATYRRALAQNPQHIDLRLKLVRLLQSQGELDKAIAEYEALIRAAPNNPQFVFEQCEALMQRGDRARALSLLTQLEARASGDEESLSRLADFYGRIGETEKSMRVLTRLTQIGANDPQHLVELGDRQYQDGNTTQAVATWKRILTTISPRSRALSALGDVYLEHDMVADALAAFREAVQLDPGNVAYKKQLASALERTKSFREAQAIWQELADRAKKQGDKVLAREARSRLVTLWGLQRILEAQIGILAGQFGASPPDLEAGRTLAEAQVHLRKLPDAEATLRKVVTLAPGDADSYLALERVLVQENKIADAIAVLEKLVVVDPKSARQLYQRMAQYALQLYKDDDAIKYAAKAVELNPDDAEGHRRLGDMYRSRQDVERAIVEYRAAIAKNDRLFIVYFSLADLLLSKGQPDEADKLFRRVVRGAPDEELVARAARLSMQINLGKGTLESLEQDLLPLAIGNPQRGIYRRLLVEIYGNLTFGLVQRVRRGEGKDAEEARKALSRVGARAVKPLLDALADGDPAQQRIAIDVLGYVQNKNAGPALFAFATGPAELSLRQRAMVACGALKDPGLLGRYEQLLSPKGQSDDAMPSDPVAVAATWGVARMGDKRALPLLRAVQKRGTPEMRALAAVGLGLLRDGRSTPEVVQMVRGPDSGSLVRAAAAFALGELGVESEAPTLLSLAQGTDSLARSIALLSLARMGAAKNGEPPGGKAAIAAMADAVFAGAGSESARSRANAEALRAAGAASLVVAAGGAPPGAFADPLPIPDGQVDVEAMLQRLVPRELPAKDRHAAVVRYADALQRAALSAVATSADRARAVLDAVGPGEELAPLLVAGDASPTASAARDKARAIARTIEPSVVGSLVRHPDVALRTKAVLLLSRSPEDAARAAVVAAVSDPSEGVQRVALAAIGSHPDPQAAAAVAKLVASHENWAVRVLAAQALGRLGASGSGAQPARALVEAATRDAYALVREAALRALASFDPRGAAALAKVLADSDPEPRVRETAKELSAPRGRALNGPSWPSVSQEP
jgi:tetratricopeptide (TPR) repeat protein/HEAT repeat protein